MILFTFHQGVAYVHASPIGSHGSLTSGKCLIDSRWVCKVSEFGTTAFREGEENKLSEEAIYAGNDMMMMRQKKDCLLVLHNFFRKGSVGRVFSSVFCLFLYTKSRSVGRENFLKTFYFLKTFFYSKTCFGLAKSRSVGETLFFSSTF